MAEMEEQVIRSDTSPCVVNDTDKSGGDLTYEELEQRAFWIERAASFLVVFNWVLSDEWWFLSFAYTFLIISNFFYIYINLRRLIRAEPHPPSVAGDNKSRRGGGGELIKEEDFAFMLERLATISVFHCWVLSHESYRQRFRRYAVLLFILSNLVYIKSYFIPEESKVQVKAKDERNEIDEENTGQEKAKLYSSLKEPMEEEKARDEMNNKDEESEEESEEFHGWEEERSQLMYELGAARASFEIYRQLLHDLHYHQP